MEENKSEVLILQNRLQECVLDNGKEIQLKPNSSFKNQAEIAWDQIRKQWTGGISHKPKFVTKDPNLSWTWTTTYEDLLSSTKPFHQPIPLSEMVEFLVDIWLDDELDD
ncbi:hypothetical protein Droror1_Dr00008796 [Drosera rotundifolia]